MDENSEQFNFDFDDYIDEIEEYSENFDEEITQDFDEEIDEDYEDVDDIFNANNDFGEKIEVTTKRTLFSKETTTVYEDGTVVTEKKGLFGNEYKVEFSEADERPDFDLDDIPDKKGGNLLGKFGKNIKNAGKAVVGAAFGIGKEVIKNADPLKGGINTKKADDTGVEGIKLVRQSIKKVESTVKTTKKVLKTPKQAIQIGKKIAKAPVAIGKAVITLGKITVETVAHVVAMAINPLTWVVLGIIIILGILASSVVILFGGDEANKIAMTNAVGLGDNAETVAEKYANGLEMLNFSLENARAEFNGLIDSHTYNNEINQLQYNDLISLRRTETDGSQSLNVLGFATENHRNTLKNRWFPVDNIVTTDFLAIAYIYLEIQANIENETPDQNEIYYVEYTQEVIDTIVAEFIKYSETYSGKSYCPLKICIEYTETTTSTVPDGTSYENPDYTDLKSQRDSAYDYLQYVKEIHDGLLYGQYGYYLSTVVPAEDDYNDLCDDCDNFSPKTIDNYTTVTENKIKYRCDGLHDCYEIGLQQFDREMALNALNFTEYQKAWVELTIMGFENNSEISQEN